MLKIHEFKQIIQTYLLWGSRISGNLRHWRHFGNLIWQQPSCISWSLFVVDREPLPCELIGKKDPKFCCLEDPSSSSSSLDWTEIENTHTFEIKSKKNKMSYKIIFLLTNQMINKMFWWVSELPTEVNGKCYSGPKVNICIGLSSAKIYRLLFIVLFHNSPEELCKQ